MSLFGRVVTKKAVRRGRRGEENKHTKEEASSGQVKRMLQLEHGGASSGRRLSSGKLRTRHIARGSLGQPAEAAVSVVKVA